MRTPYRQFSITSTPTGWKIEHRSNGISWTCKGTLREARESVDRHLKPTPPATVAPRKPEVHYVDPCNHNRSACGLRWPFDCATESHNVSCLKCRVTADAEARKIMRQYGDLPDGA